MRKFFSWLKNLFTDMADEFNLAAVDCQIRENDDPNLLDFYQKAHEELLARIETREDQQQQKATAH